VFFKKEYFVIEPRPGVDFRITLGLECFICKIFIKQIFQYIVIKTGEDIIHKISHLGPGTRGRALIFLDGNSRAFLFRAIL
jgi:hypothetical protein